MKSIYQHISSAILILLILSACSDTDIIPNLSSATTPSSIEMVIPTEMQQYIYTDGTGTSVLPLIKGQTVTLGATLMPDSITYDDLNWTSSEPSVAAVDEGVVSALSGSGLGYSVITVTPVGMYSGSGVASSLKVKVDDELVPATAITLDADTDEVYIGEQLALTYDIEPEITTYRTISWTSSDESVATVNSKGVVTGVAVNYNTTSTKVTITGTALDGSGITASKEITVKRIVQPEQVTLSQTYSSDNGYTCAYNEQGLTIGYTTYPADCTTSLIQWTSSDESIATVNDGKVTFKGFGEVTITATCPATGYTSSVKLNIPVGFIREVFHNESHYSLYNASQSGNGTSTSHEWHDGYLTITTYTVNATTQRADLRWWDTPVTLHAGKYPILAVKMDDVKDLNYGITSRNINFDVVGTSESGTSYKALGNGNNKWLHDYKCSDGSHVFVYDLSSQEFGTGGLAPTTESIKFTTFQLKYADMKSVDHQVTYNLYWMQSFQSIEDVIDYITKVDGLTYETIK
ncbi:MAG: DUF4979 domain-containing protein [Prevotella sp.]|nr:DUF4979 domain-containing protein [Prevotella sp.]